MKIDQNNREIDAELMNRLSQKVYQKDYVDLKEFVTFFSDQPIDEIKMKVGAIYGHSILQDLN